MARKSQAKRQARPKHTSGGATDRHQDQGRQVFVAVSLAVETGGGTRQRGKIYKNCRVLGRGALALVRANGFLSSARCRVLCRRLFLSSAPCPLFPHHLRRAMWGVAGQCRTQESSIDPDTRHPFPIAPA